MTCQQQSIIIICQLFFLYNGICSHSHFDNRFVLWGKDIQRERLVKLYNMTRLKIRNEPKSAHTQDRTTDLQFTRLTLYH